MRRLFSRSDNTQDEYLFSYQYITYNEKGFVSRILFPRLHPANGGKHCGKVSDHYSRPLITLGLKPFDKLRANCGTPTNAPHWKHETRSTKQIKIFKF